MTDVNPPNDHTEQQTEVLGTAPTGGRRALVITLVAALVVAVLGGGAWAAYSFLSGGGPRPDEALPASTVAVVSIDLDPSAGQKIAAIKAIRKFPSLKKSLGLEADDDLRKFIFDKATESGDCDDLDFDDDVKPWIGKRAALGAVDLGDDTPAPVIALQITDRDKARTGISRIADCAGAGDDFKWAIGDDYLIASDSQEHADEIQRTGEKTPLADDAAYQRWTDEAGDAGVLNFYVSKKVTEYFSDLLDSLGDEIFGLGSDSAFDGSAYSGDVGSGLSAPHAADEPDPLEGVRDELDKFEGMAGSVRFADGGMELSFAAGGLTSVASAAKVGKQVGALPKDTVFALGFGVPDDIAEVFTDGFKSGAGDLSDDALASVEEETGLKLPGDLQTLLGNAVILSIGSDLLPADLDDIEGFDEIPIGLVIHGDAAEIKDLISSIEEHTGFSLADIPVSVLGDDDKVVLSPSQDWAEALLRKGSLGSTDTFTDAVPDAERTNAIAYLNFNSKLRSTLIQFAEEGGAKASEVRTAEANTKPLKSLGISSWLDGKVSHVLIKVATD